MNILKHLFSYIALLFIISTGVYADDSDKKKCHYKDGKKCHEKMWRKKDMWKQRPMMRIGGPFAMIEAQGRLFLYNKKTGDVWLCNTYKKICEQLVIENKDID